MNSGLKQKFSKCETTGIGSLKGVEVAVCGRKFVNLKKNVIKIHGIHLSYSKKLNMEKKSSAVKRSNIEKALKIWHMGNLTGKCLR